MKSKLSSNLLYNKYLNENKLIGVTYYPSKQGGFQFLLIVKSGIKVDFVKYNFISYRKLFNISEGEELVIPKGKMKDVVNTFDKIYIPIKSIKGYSYEKTEKGFNTYLRVEINDQIKNKLITKFEKEKLNLIDEDKNPYSVMFEDILESEGFVKVNQVDVQQENKEFKNLKLGVNDTIGDLFYI